MIPKPALELGTPCPISTYPFCPGTIPGPNSVIISIKTQLNPQNSGILTHFHVATGHRQRERFWIIYFPPPIEPGVAMGPGSDPTQFINFNHTHEITIDNNINDNHHSNTKKNSLNTTYKYTIDSGLPKHHNHPSPMYINGGPSMCTNITDVHQRGPLNEMAHTERPGMYRRPGPRVSPKVYSRNILCPIDKY